MGNPHQWKMMGGSFGSFVSDVSIVNMMDGAKEKMAGWGRANSVGGVGMGDRNMVALGKDRVDSVLVCMCEGMRMAVLVCLHEGMRVLVGNPLVLTGSRACSIRRL